MFFTGYSARASLRSLPIISALEVIMKSLFLKGAAIVFAAALASGAANAQIKLGVAGPITGPNASFGAQLTNRVAQAAEDINKAGGILRQNIEVQHSDDL